MADFLLNCITDADAGPATPSRQTNKADTDAATSRQALSRTKRTQVAAACLACRTSKIKCDAARPCGQCQRKKTACQYDTRVGETNSQASKRKYGEITQSHEIYAEIFQSLKSLDHREAAGILQHIRADGSPEDVLKRIKIANVASPIQPHGRGAFDALLISLAHSTASIHDVVDLTSSALYPTDNINLPDAEQFLFFRNRIVRPRDLWRFLRRHKQLADSHPASPHALLVHPNDSSAASGSGEQISDSPSRNEPGEEIEPYRARSHDGDNTDDDAKSFDASPPQIVSAAPWTDITTSDEAVSHLVSLFLAWINPTWRFVEQDLFLRGMHSNRLSSDYCSPFLVNSICAIASVSLDKRLHSEHDVAFVNEDRDRITRGQHFHDEALRLWALEERRANLTNIQALCILSLESNYRAMDRLGLTLIPIAVQLDNEVPVTADERRCVAQGVSVREFARVRLATHWTAKYAHIIMSIAFMSRTTVASNAFGLPKIHDVFDDEVEPWVGYPLARQVILSRPTLYFRQRCDLAEFTQELHDVIFGKEQRKTSVRDFVGAMNGVAAKMQQWYRHLPFELHYEWPVSVDVWELHASYLTLLMTLALETKKICETRQEELNNKTPPVDVARDYAVFLSRTAKEKTSEAVSLAHTAAGILRDFRENYGLKILPAWMLQLQAVAASVLMLDPELAEPTIIDFPEVRAREVKIADSRAAFDEVFRSLLGAGVEVLISRGIARMMYHTALEREIALSRPTRTLLQVMSSTAWRPSDLALVSSRFPNFASTQGHETGERMTELLSKWEKLDI